MSELQHRIDRLSPEKRRLLELLRASRGGEAGSAATQGAFSLVSDVDRATLPPGLEDAYPLASMQLGMLYHMNLTRDDPVPAYHNVFQYRVDRAIDVGVLRRALERVIARHAVLRTSFDLTHYSQPLQLVHARVQPILSVIDLSGLDPSGREREIAHFLVRENRRLVDVTRAPLLRFTVHRLAPDRFCFTMTELHAIAEGWGTYLTLEELRRTYLALSGVGALPQSPAPAHLYREFVRLEQEALGSEEHREFWTRQLEGAPRTRLPRLPDALRRRSGRAGRTRIVELEPQLAERLFALVASSGLPLKSLLLAAYLRVLAELGGSREVLSGLSVHNRPTEEGADAALGVFVNTVPMRMKLRAESWLELARRCFEAEVGLMPYSRYPLAAMQRGPGKRALIDAVFGFIHFHYYGDVEVAQDVRIGSGADRSVSHFPLVVFFRREDHPRPGLTIWIENDDREITAGQVQRWVDYLRAALRQMASDPGADATACRLVSVAQAHQRAREWNDSASALPAGTLAALLARPIAARPGAVAAECEGSSISYGELDRRAEALAASLEGYGVGPEVRVGVFLDRTLDLPVALLAVARAGGAFVPLDVGHPPERCRRLLERSEAVLVVTDEQHAPTARAWDLPVLTVASPPPMPARRRRSASPSNLAYLLFTSGSTGEPKGVMVSQRGAVRYLEWAARSYQLGSGRGTPVHSSPAVDMTLTSLLAPLVAGGRTLLLPTGEGGAGETLERLLALPGGLDVVKLTPTHLGLVCARLASARAAGWCSRLVIGGEVLTGAAVDAWRRLAPETPVINEYGPTETVVGCGVYEVIAGTSGVAPIGRPIEGARLYVTQELGGLALLGTDGELLIAGEGVARGYIGMPARTAESFVPDPWSDRPGARLYRSGDRARYLPDGAIEVVGRLDEQVKIRGHRVEPGEVEAELAAHPAVRRAAVVTRANGDDGARLVAYLEALSEPAPTVAELRRHLGARLPDALVPSTFVVLPEIPVAASGKLDRSALPDPGAERPDVGRAFVAPRSSAERKVAEIWRRVTGLDRIGVEDSFFDLGGDSLLLLRAQSMIEESFERELSIAELFRHPTIASLAAFLAGAGGASKAPRSRASSEVQRAVRRRTMLGAKRRAARRIVRRHDE